MSIHNRKDDQPFDDLLFNYGHVREQWKHPNALADERPRLTYNILSRYEFDNLCQNKLNKVIDARYGAMAILTADGDIADGGFLEEAMRIPEWLDGGCFDDAGDIVKEKYFDYFSSKEIFSFIISFNKKVYNFDASDLLIEKSDTLSYSEIKIYNYYQDYAYIVDLIGVSGYGDLNVSIDPNCDIVDDSGNAPESISSNTIDIDTRNDVFDIDSFYY